MTIADIIVYVQKIAEILVHIQENYQDSHSYLQELLIK